jgi:hypothetical protein
VAAAGTMASVTSMATAVIYLDRALNDDDDNDDNDNNDDDCDIIGDFNAGNVNSFDGILAQFVDCRVSVGRDHIHTKFVFKNCFFCMNAITY